MKSESHPHRSWTVSSARTSSSFPSDETYRVLFDRNPLPMWVFDRRTLRFLAVNDCAIEHYGYSRPEFLSMTIKEIRPSEDVPKLLKALPDYPDGVRLAQSFRHRKKDGSEIDVEITRHKLIFDRKPAFLTIVHEVTENHNLSIEMTRVQDSERRRMARELHDNTVQTLAGLVLRLEQLNGSLSRASPDCRQAVTDCEELAEKCISELRTLSYLFHPPTVESLGLHDAVVMLVHGFTKRSMIHVDLEIPRDIGTLPREVEETLYRVIQESLLNVQHHSGAKRANVRFSRDRKKVAVRIEDSGCGLRLPDIEIDNMGVGIPGMRERLNEVGGRLEISSSLKGTTVRAVVPLDQQK